MTKHWHDHTPFTATIPSGKRRTIIFLGTAHDNGGSSILGSNLAAAMRAAGHDVEEWYLFQSASATMPPGARVFFKQGRSRSPLTLIPLFAKVISELRRRRPDTVYGLQSLSNLLAGIGGRLAGASNRIATLHIPADKFNSALMMLDGIVGRLGFYSCIIACGQSVADTFAYQGKAYMRHVTVVPNGHRKPAMIDRASARQELGLPATGTVIGQLGRLYYQKGQRFSLDLLQQLPDVTLLLVGVGPDEDMLKSAVAAAGLADRVTFVRHIDHDRVGIFFSATDLVLFPSLFEGLSLSAIETIHAGVPLVCSDIPSFREMFKPSAFLTEAAIAPLGDPDVWLKRVRMALADPDYGTRFRHELAQLSPTYRFETMANQYLALLD